MVILSQLGNWLINLSLHLYCSKSFSVRCVYCLLFYFSVQILSVSFFVLYNAVKNQTKERKRVCTTFCCQSHNAMCHILQMQKLPWCDSANVSYTKKYDHCKWKSERCRCIKNCHNYNDVLSYLCYNLDFWIYSVS